MKAFLNGLLLILFGILIGGVIALTTAPPRGEPITLLPPPTPLPLLIDVKGAVTQPGLVALPPASRIQHALEAAGGPLPEADLTSINLAAPVEDGMFIFVPFLPPNEPAPMPLEETSPPTTPINVNTATVEELATLPGIGLETAQRIVDYRMQFGPFTTLQDLDQVFGIGPATLADLEAWITFGP
ncbi:MAG: helix-hairpin-helix domain-containing protein [Anaerolineales bacterium]